MSEPTLLALLTADKVMPETNGKHSVIGDFDKFDVMGIPSPVRPWGIFVSMGNFSGKRKVTVNMVHDQSSQVVVCGPAGLLTISLPCITHLL